MNISNGFVVLQMLGATHLIHFLMKKIGVIWESLIEEKLNLSKLESLKKLQELLIAKRCFANAQHDSHSEQLHDSHVKQSYDSQSEQSHASHSGESHYRHSEQSEESTDTTTPKQQNKMSA